jgi:hypothetical protein
MMSLRNLYTLHAAVQIPVESPATAQSPAAAAQEPLPDVARDAADDTGADIQLASAAAETVAPFP